MHFRQFNTKLYFNVILLRLLYMQITCLYAIGSVHKNKNSFLASVLTAVDNVTVPSPSFSDIPNDLQVLKNVPTVGEFTTTINCICSLLAVHCRLPGRRMQSVECVQDVSSLSVLIS